MWTQTDSHPFSKSCLKDSFIHAINQTLENQWHFRPVITWDQHSYSSFLMLFLKTDRLFTLDWLDYISVCCILWAEQQHKLTEIWHFYSIQHLFTVYIIGCWILTDCCRNEKKRGGGAPEPHPHTTSTAWTNRTLKGLICWFWTPETNIFN